MHHTLRISSRIMTCWPIIAQRLSLTKSCDISKADGSWRFEELFVFPRDWRGCDVVEPDGRPLDYWTLCLLIGGELSKASWFSCSIVWCCWKGPKLSYLSLTACKMGDIALCTTATGSCPTTSKRLQIRAFLWCHLLFKIVNNHLYHTLWLSYVCLSEALRLHSLAHAQSRVQYASERHHSDMKLREVVA